MDCDAEGMLDDCADGDARAASRQPADRARPPRLRAGDRGGARAAGDGYDRSYAGEKRLKGLSAPLKTYRGRALTATSDG
jgi:hypothetical protein